MCGNDLNDSPSRPTLVGSPPLVRERPDFAGGAGFYRGITPACAGTTHLHSAASFETEDHPRLCGNDAGIASTFALSVGSPPLVRERHDHLRVPSAPRGITPACAGTTTLDCRRRRGSRDHPRLCGNDSEIQKGVRTKLGSPPLVRERQGVHLPDALVSRITPACAGTT